MNEDFPWFILALVIISFIRWLVGKIQGKNLSEELTDIEETFLAGEEENKRDRAEAERKKAAKPRPVVTNRSDPTLDPNEEIRKFFEALGRKPEEPAVELRPPVSPPPLPAPLRRPATPSLARARAVKPRLSPAEEEALKRVRARRDFKVTKRESETAGPRAASVSIRDAIRSSGGLKTAVVLKEILDQPKGLKPLLDSHTF